MKIWTQVTEESVTPPDNRIPVEHSQVIGKNCWKTQKEMCTGKCHLGPDDDDDDELFFYFNIIERRFNKL